MDKFHTQDCQITQDQKVPLMYKNRLYYLCITLLNILYIFIVHLDVLSNHMAL